MDPKPENQPLDELVVELEDEFLIDDKVPELEDEDELLEELGL